MLVVYKNISCQDHKDFSFLWSVAGLQEIRNLSIYMGFFPRNDAKQLRRFQATCFKVFPSLVEYSVQENATFFLSY